MPDRCRRVSSNKYHRQTLSDFRFAVLLLSILLMSCAYCNYPLQDTAVCGSVRHFELNSSLVPGTSFLGRTGLLYVLRAACGELASGTRVALNTTYDSSSLFVFHTCLHCSTVQVSVRLCHLQADSVNLDRGVHGHSQTKIVMYQVLLNLSALCRGTAVPCIPLLVDYQ